MKTITLNSRAWKGLTTCGDLCKHYIGVYAINGVLVGYHVALILTDAPTEYHEGYKIVRRFKNKYLIRAQESYTYETWACILESIYNIVEANQQGNIFDK